MKPTAVFVLVLVNAVLLLALVTVWSGGSRDWSPPAPQRPDAASLEAEKIDLRRADMMALDESLKRPLFTATRRPAPAPVDGFDAIDGADPVLLGIFAAEGGGKGVILRVDGKVRRLRVGETLGSWTLDAMDDQGGAIFKRADEQLEVQLRHLPQAEAQAEPSPPGTPRGRAAPRRNSGTGSPASRYLRPGSSLEPGPPSLAHALRRPRSGSITID